MPFMPLFVEMLGAPKATIEVYSGLAVSLSALAAALVSPIWGKLADRFGRKPMMVRASLVMTFTMGGLAFVPNVFWLLSLRVLNGLFSGYVPNSTALIAAQTPKHKTGYALGTLTTGLTAGTLIGPLLGGFLADQLGIRAVFLLVAGLLLLVNVLTIFGVKEDFTPQKAQEVLPTRAVFAQIADKRVLFGLFVTSLIIQVTAQSIAPILTLYIRHLGQADNLMFISGLIVSAMGFSSMLSSSLLGKLGDKIGNHRLLLLALGYSFVMYFFMARAQAPLSLGLLRFCYGFGVGALMPSINALLNKITPKAGISRIFSYNQMFSYMGQVVGPFIGSAVAVQLGYRWVFYVTSLIVLTNFVWSLIIFRKYLKVKEIV